MDTAFSFSCDCDDDDDNLEEVVGVEMVVKAVVVPDVSASARARGDSFMVDRVCDGDSDGGRRC